MKHAPCTKSERWGEMQTLTIKFSLAGKKINTSTFSLSMHATQRESGSKLSQRGRGDRYYGRINFRPFKVSAQDKKDEKWGFHVKKGLAPANWFVDSDFRFKWLTKAVTAQEQKTLKFHSEEEATVWESISTPLFHGIRICFWCGKRWIDTGANGFWFGNSLNIW